MKRIFLKNLGILLIGSISFAACKKAAPGESGGPAPSSKRLIKSEVDAANYSAYEYNADGLLSKVTEIEEGQTVSVLTFAIANKKVTEASYNSGEKLRFVYNGENIDTMKIYSGVGVYAGFVKYKYEGGRNIQQSFFFSDG